MTSTDIENFLGDCQVTNVRIVEDKMDHRPKGFGYVEFATVDGLKKALTLSETQFQGRNIRISVAEPRKYLACYDSRLLADSIFSQPRTAAVRDVRSLTGPGKVLFRTYQAKASAGHPNEVDSVGITRPRRTLEASVAETSVDQASSRVMARCATSQIGSARARSRQRQAQQCQCEMEVECVKAARRASADSLLHGARDARKPAPGHHVASSKSDRLWIARLQRPIKTASGGRT